MKIQLKTILILLPTLICINATASSSDIELPQPLKPLSILKSAKNEKPQAQIKLVIAEKNVKPVKKESTDKSPMIVKKSLVKKPIRKVKPKTALLLPKANEA